MMETGIVCDTVTNIIKQYKTPLIVGGLFVAAVKGYSIYQEQQRRLKWNSYGKDVVVLHGVRGITVPSVSPFVMKLEMFLKMAGIKYVFDSSSAFGSKTKTPWITLNGEDCCDSELILDFLKRKLPNVNLNTHLTVEQKAISRAFQIMTDEHIFWGLVLHRFYFDQGKQFLRCFNVPLNLKIMITFIGGTYYKRSKSQGIGLHSKREIEGIIRKDLEAISLFLGNKRYMMGDNPCEVDCAIFSFMAQLVWVDTTSPYAKMLQDDYSNIVDYCYTVKTNIWPDWQQCCD